MVTLSPKNNKLTEEGRQRLRMSRIGKKMSEETKEKIRIANIGKKYSQSTKDKLSALRKGRKFTDTWRKNMSLARKGDKSHFWRGGVSKNNILLRGSVEYKLWREAVFKRDNWKCIWCGNNGNLNADHIKPFAYYPELRFAIDNGRTLCIPCHRTTDTFGINKPITK